MCREEGIFSNVACMKEVGFIVRCEVCLVCSFVVQKGTGKLVHCFQCLFPQSFAGIGLGER